MSLLSGKNMHVLLIPLIALSCFEWSSAANMMSLAKDCWDPNEPFHRSPLRNATSVNNSTTQQQPLPALTPGRQQDAQIRIAIDADSYRIGQKVTVTVSSDNPFEAYVITATGSTVRNTDEVWPGNFLPESSDRRQVLLSCNEQLNSAAASGPERSDFRSVSASWLPPDRDVGLVSFKVAVLRGNVFWTNETARLQFFPFPPPIDQCGERKFCLRKCNRAITNCPSSEAEIVYMQDKWEGREPLLAVLGGVAPGPMDFVAMGYTADKDQLSNSDLTICARSLINSTTSTTRPILQHFLMERLEYGPKRSGLNEGSENFNIDSSSTMDDVRVWCKFTRPVTGLSRKTLDLKKPLYKFYFTGTRNENGDVVIPKEPGMLLSANKYNVSRVADIYYFGAASQATQFFAKNGFSAVLLFWIMRQLTVSSFGFN
ncbi:unnamed protein product [Notodromas monacha]|uniref:Reelin domain-containing protein n=1 Tax=Notodromas monacha TaxID=399045 RepID=A0A7R9BPH0_9CRUS|nr:unnamed protein product [Notodromas monacha]CAG0918406.1 unnamed protein product [Notodromas monacha]